MPRANGPKPAPLWKGGVRELFELRNRFVHFKDGVKYLGFAFASPIQKELREAALQQMRDAVGLAVADIAVGYPPMRTGFLRGRYQIFFNTEEEDPDSERHSPFPVEDPSDERQSVRSSPPAAEELSNDPRLEGLVVSTCEKGVLIRIAPDDLFRPIGTEVHPNGKELLARLGATLLERCAGVMIVVEGHTGTGGSRAAECRRTVQRAEYVREGLLHAGVAPWCVEARGFGPDSPIESNDTVEGRQMNRRIDVILLDSQP